MEMDRIASAPEAIEPGVFTPGDFTPLWGQASACRIERTLRWKVTVPLITEFNYVACGAGHARHTATCGARVQQRLVVVKDANNGGEAFYIESIAPTDGRDDCNVGSGDFAGIVMYHTYDGGLVRFDCYEGGEKPAGFYLGGADGERERAGLEEFLATRDNIYIARQRHISTRGGSENWWDKTYDAGSIEEVIVQGKRGGSNSGCSYCGSPYCSYGYAGHSSNGGTGSSGNGVNYGGGGASGGSPDPGSGSGGGSGSSGGGNNNPPPSPDIVIPEVFVLGKGSMQFYSPLIWTSNWRSWWEMGGIVGNNITFTYDPAIEAENSDRINDRINKLLKDCLGAQLINALKSFGVDISIMSVDNLLVGNNAVNGVYSPTNHAIIVANSSDIGTFFEEVYHAWQFNRLGADMQYLSAYPGNTEIEAKMAKNLFLKRTGYSSTDYYSRNSTDLIKFARNPNQHNWELLQLDFISYSGYDGRYRTSTNFNDFRFSSLNIDC